MRTYGTVWLEGPSFLIQCEPHVVIRLKRVFAKVDARQHGFIRITATEETARDLQWFTERFPLDMDDACQEKIATLAGRHRERVALAESILSGRIAVADFGLAIPLREYQQVAAEIAFQRQNLLLADDVGLGKTASSIGLMGRGVTLPALVVTLTHLPLQWRDEIGKFAPHLSCHIVSRGEVYDVAERHARGKRGPKVLPDVIVISYSKLSKWADLLAPLVRTVIFDECQELRKSGSQKWNAAAHLSAHATWRMGLSATPIYNYGSEIWNVCECIAPGALGSRSEFITEWCTFGWGGDEKARIKEPAAFGSYMRETGMMLRRTRKDVGRELQALNKSIQHIDADLAALDQVSVTAAELARAILDSAEEYRGEKMHMSQEFSNLLRQATGIAKAPYVAEFVKLLLESEARVVLYGWHREVYSIWLDRLKEFNPVMYTGSESPSQKELAKFQFTQGNSRVLIISLRAGAGLDGLQFSCRTVVFGELDWSPGVHEQCEGRILRDGQSEPVFAYYLLSESGADPTIASVLGIKKQQIGGIRNDSEGQLFTQLQSGGDHIKALARDFLARNRHPAPEDSFVCSPKATQGPEFLDPFSRFQEERA